MFVIVHCQPSPTLPQAVVSVLSRVQIPLHFPRSVLSVWPVMEFPKWKRRGHSIAAVNQVATEVINDGALGGR